MTNTAEIATEVEGLIDARSASFIEGTTDWLGINARLAEIAETSAAAAELVNEAQARRFR